MDGWILQNLSEVSKEVCEHSMCMLSWLHVAVSQNLTLMALQTCKTQAPDRIRDPTVDMCTMYMYHFLSNNLDALQISWQYLHQVYL